MRIRLRTLGVAGAGLSAFLAAAPASATTPQQMMQDCRARAGETFRTRLPNIETKYEGQRTDGTHAVNGTARFDGRTETFQCSFNRSGRRIERFVVNRPSGGSSGSSSSSNRRDRTAAAIVGGILGAIALAASSHNHRHELHRPSGSATQLPNRRTRPYSPAARVTCYPSRRACYRDNGRLAAHWTRKEF